MDPFIDELRKTSLQYNEKKLLDAGDVSGCFAVLLNRRHRADRLTRWMFMGVLICPVVLQLLALVMNQDTSPRHDPMGFQFTMFTWIGLLYVSNFVGSGLESARVETLYTIWRTTVPSAVREQSVAPDSITR